MISAACYLTPALAQLLQNLTFIQHVFYSPYSCGIELHVSLCSAFHIADILSYRPFTAFAPPSLQSALTKPSHRLPAAFSCAQEAASHRFLSQYCISLSFYYQDCLFFYFFPPYALFLLDFSRVWFCKILRAFNCHWLLWNIKVSALCGTDPLSLHRLCTCKPSMSLGCYTVRMCSSLDIPGVHFESKYFNGTILKDLLFYFVFFSFFLFYFIFLCV